MIGIGGLEDKREFLDDEAGDNWGLTSEIVGVFLFTILSGLRRVGGSSAFCNFSLFWCLVLGF